jgi:hypothetical protein
MFEIESNQTLPGRESMIKISNEMVTWALKGNCATGSSLMAIRNIYFI